MKNLIFVPFAFDENKASGANVAHNEAMGIYLKSLSVSLLSAKKTNPTADVALVCNAPLPAEYASLLNNNGVLIFVEPFDSFLFENDYKWCLAFYKLCALEKMVQNYEYDNYMYTDADVYFQNPVEYCFTEARDNVLLYDINHGLNVPNYATTLDQFRDFGVDTYITQYGGEFFCASRENAKIFVAHCKDVYNAMMDRHFRTNKGDEFITSIAASRMKEKIKNAGAYIYRFWTGGFYLVSTCYRFNEISILHLPAEKQAGILKLFTYFRKTGQFPSKDKVHGICHLTHRPIKMIIKQIVRRCLGEK